jgi:hypothetical protein
MKVKNYMLEEVKVWLDDERKAPPGYIHFTNVSDLKKFYKKNHNKIDKMSLDHDLGDNVPTGYDFMLWLEEMIFYDIFQNMPKIKVHSANPIGKKKMLQSIKSLEKRK